MCLIAFAWETHPDYRLILAANRDEFHARPAAALQWWSDEPAVLGGRDLEAGGTWLAVGKSGRFATVTNYREDLKVQRGFRSRGELVAAFVTGRDAPERFATGIEGNSYAGVNVLAGDFTADFTAGRASLAYVSNRGDPARLLTPGIYGLSNASLDTPWPKVRRSKSRLAAIVEARVKTSDEDVVLDQAVDVAALFALLADREPGSREDIADVIADDLPPEMARAIAAPFVVTPGFGTRCSTVVVVRTAGKVDVYERRFDPSGQMTGESQFAFDIE